MELLKSWKTAHKVSVIQDGEKATQYFADCGNNRVKPLPDLVLLDYNLPKSSGLEVLKEIKSYNTLSHIPVLILTTSQSKTDLTQLYENHANCVLSKPVDLVSYEEMLKAIETFWLQTVHLPSITRA
ncbi:MAG: response regulator [Deltaproteobacteria bacterium]|nr:response regulator [Deltaproteobacteria bacterium]